ncbi:MAG TPA: pirin family protein [Gammaproteobacteria bacterium]|nr:pirin family protein [Gammaproteobacteria bacterium]
MDTVIHRADARGRADHGWLQARYSFSFADWYEPTRMHFGRLRVLNDDIIAPAGGFDTHAHDNMEIVTVPLAGALRHRDSMGHEQVLHAGEVQVMSAGSGLRHSEFNASDTEPVNLLQIWVLPKERDVTPRYDQQAFAVEERHNRLQTLVAPGGQDGALWVNQDTWFSRGDFDAGQSLDYALHGDGNGVYVFVIDGRVTLAGETLARRDAMGAWNTDNVHVDMLDDSALLFIEVPI